MKTCLITFKSKNNRFLKGEQYEILPMVGLPGVKLFKIIHSNGSSFFTDEAHTNKFFA